MAIATALVFRELNAPLWLVHVVRVVELALTVVLILVVIESISGRPMLHRPPWLRWLLLGLLIWLLREVFAQKERWDAPLWLGGTPTTIAIELCVLASLVSCRRHKLDEGPKARRDERW